MQDAAVLVAEVTMAAVVAEGAAVVADEAATKQLIILQRSGRSCHMRNAIRSARNVIRRENKEAPNVAYLNSPLNN